VTKTSEQIDVLYELIRKHPARLELARTAHDVGRITDTGRIASMIGVEGGHSIGGSLGTLRILARLGAGYLTLTQRRHAVGGLGHGRTPTRWAHRVRRGGGP